MEHGAMGSVMKFLYPLVVGVAVSDAMATETTTFTYDTLGRLKTSVVTGGTRHGVQQTFKYDNANNRTELSTVSASSLLSPTITPSSTTVGFMGPGRGVFSINLGTGVGGSAEFFVDGAFAGSVNIVNGQARLALPNLAPGDYTITVNFSGDATHNPASSTFQVKLRDLSWLPAVLQLITE